MTLLSGNQESIFLMLLGTPESPVGKPGPLRILPKEVGP